MYRLEIESAKVEPQFVSPLVCDKTGPWYERNIKSKLRQC